MDASRFADRRDAGRRLAEALARLALPDPLVLALPRGGVPVAYEISRRLGAPLDLMLVRKLGAPGHAELGIGAVVDGSNPQTILNDAVVDELHPGAAYIKAETKRQLTELERRRLAYRGTTPPPPIAGRTIILVDDGIATGGTVRAALTAARRAGAARLVLAVAVAPASVLAELKPLADDIVCLATPSPFYAISLHYADFAQTSDDEVIKLLREAEGRSKA